MLGPVRQNVLCSLGIHYTGRYAMIPFINQAQGYAAYQQNVTTRYIHIVSVPLILFSVMILLGFIRVIILGVLNIDLAEIATLGLLVYYFCLQWRLALALAPVMIFLLWVAECFSYAGPSSFALEAFAITFLIGSVLQYASYFIEGKRPPFSAMSQHILIAPLSLTAEVFFMVGYMQPLKDEIYSASSTSSMSNDASGV